MKILKRSIWEENKCFFIEDTKDSSYLGSVDANFLSGKLEIKNNTLKRDDIDIMDILNKLEGCEGKFIFANLDELRDFCILRNDLTIPGPFYKMYKGFKIYEDTLVFYVLIRPWSELIPITINVFDREALMIQFAKEKNMPIFCHGTSPFTGERVRIRYLDDFEVFPQYGCDKKENGNYADECNKSLKVSIKQRRAMENGCVYGWDSPLANPENYTNDGFYLVQEAKKKRSGIKSEPRF
ncbi:MAG: hypothetical protein MJ236_00935 [Clostridia bacterium]|nr:hypothetical protein [Clostridia bacterium]